MSVRVHPQWESMVAGVFGRVTAMSDEGATYHSVIGPGLRLGTRVTVHRTNSTEEVTEEQVRALVEVAHLLRARNFFVGAANPVWMVVDSEERSQVFEFTLPSDPKVVLAVALNAQPR